MPEEEFNPYKKNVSMQRLIMGRYFFPFFVENIKKYKSKLPTLKPIAEDLIEDMRLFLIENLWMADKNGDMNLSIIEKITYQRAMELFGDSSQKEFSANEKGQKVQNIIWTILKDVKISAQYVLIDKNWILNKYLINN